MKLRMLLAGLAMAVLLGVPHGLAVDPVLVAPGDEDLDCNGAAERTVSYPEPTDPSLTRTVHVFCQATTGTGPGALASCSSTAYTLTGWHWNARYAAKVDSANSGLSSSAVVSGFQGSGNTWDSSTSGSIMGTVSAGGSGSNAGRRDGVNQLGWKHLANGVIAQTTTWSSGSSAVESDGAYGTSFPWSTSGAANAMDLQNIATHEIGHTFGLGHPATNSANACLTMYAYADYGETQKRSLGTGDINGIKAIYG